MKRAGKGVMRGCLVVIAEMTASEAGPGAGVTRIDLDGPLKMSPGLGAPGLGEIKGAQVGIDLVVTRLEFEGLFIMALGFGGVFNASPAISSRLVQLVQ